MSSRLITHVLIAAAAILVSMVRPAGADPAPAGALIQMTMSSTVGVLLDEIPAGALREQAAANALARPAGFWEARARNHLRLMSYRLVFRSGYYPEPHGKNPKTYGPLPLPPQAVWQVTPGIPYRKKIDGHDMIVVDYTFGSYIVTDATSPGKVDPHLGRIGGTTSETFSLPVDPELLFERTGYACMDEEEFPPGSVFEENTYYYYDDTCTANSSYCHVTVRPKMSCVEALVKKTGRVRSTLQCARVPYSPAAAAPYIVGTVNPAATGADLAVVTSGISDERAFMYRFFGPGACELEEGVIGQYGWRRLLAFSASVRNDGIGPIDLGDVTDPDNPYVKSNAFEFSSCHGHYHFSHYGNFGYAGAQGNKRAFCLEETNRYHNNETTPLTANYQSCIKQGIGPGWGDEYNFGIPGQWVDVTLIDTSTPHALTFDSNPDQFLCEGVPNRDGDGKLIFLPTGYINEAGLPETRVSCAFPPGWDATNIGSVPVKSTGASFVTEPCTRGQIGPNRSCGFAEPAELSSCVTGGGVRLTCTATAPAVLRICEISGQLGVGVACTVGDSIANTTIGTSPSPVRFACPAVRDAAMVNVSGTLIPQTVAGVGGYSAYRAAIGTLGAGDDSAPTVTCAPAGP